MNTILLTCVAFVLAKWLGELWLAHLNRKEVRAHESTVPEPFKEFIDAPTYSKSVNYTLARNGFAQFSDTYRVVLLLTILLTGILPWGYTQVIGHFGTSAWAMAGFLFVVGLALAVPNIPVDWVEQFRLEQRFGFNTSTQGTWWLDRLKGLVLAILLGYPLLVLILKLVEWTGTLWWFWAWATFVGFQFLMTVISPVLILPLFNKLTPLPEGSLKERLVALANRTRFLAHSIQVIDGSRRSRHSNAFFAGFGRLRKIVLFDTLIEQLDDVELEAVLAHEIGHYKRRHIPKLLVGSALGALAAFGAMAWLANQPVFPEAFGFDAPHTGSELEIPSIAPVLLLFGLLSSTVTFWLSPVLHWLTRRYEYEADAYARKVMNDSTPLVSALRKLNQKNLSNLTPHPVYSGFYYSHPTLLEREAALHPTHRPSVSPVR